MIEVDPKLEKAVVELVKFMRSRYFGKYRGLVKSVDESDKKGRITAIVPEIYGDKESPWAFPSTPFAGTKSGFFMLPKENDGVWIEFEAGDPSRPIWSGFWWADNEVPEVAGEDKKIIVTPGGHEIILDDENDEIQVNHSSNSSDNPVQILMAGDKITLQVGRSSIVISEDSVNINNGALVVQTVV